MTDAIKGLVDALIEIRGPVGTSMCLGCRQGNYEGATHKNCPSFVARAALEAFAARKPLRDDYELFSLVTYTACVCDTEARDVLDALDDAILGPRTPAKEE